MSHNTHDPYRAISFSLDTFAALNTQRVSRLLRKEANSLVFQHRSEHHLFCMQLFLAVAALSGRPDEYVHCAAAPRSGELSSKKPDVARIVLSEESRACLSYAVATITGKTVGGDCAQAQAVAARNQRRGHQVNF
eukprot:6214230-Pleurochrysis_carterae.AAC.9